MVGDGYLQEGKDQIKWKQSGRSSRKREGDWTFKFFSGLNVEFDEARVQILGTETLPLLNEAFSIVRGEESWRAVMLEAGPNTNLGSALAA